MSSGAEEKEKEQTLEPHSDNTALGSSDVSASESNSEKEMTDNFVVPKNAVVIRDNENVIFRYGNGKAQWTYVNILMSNSESHAITANDERGSEIHEGDTVIISGNLNLADGSQVEQRR